MTLKTQRTKWVLFLSSSGPQPEFRHVMDLVFGLMCLERAGISNKDIFIYVDGPPLYLKNLFSIGSNNAYHIQPSERFFLDSSDNTHENLVMFVTGHGSPKGIDALTDITPNKLVCTLKGTPGLSNSIVYLGQCFAGLFNYVNAAKGKDGGEIIFVGATNLHESLSLSTAEEFLPGTIYWLANLFLLHVFKWISSPVDVDGDGRTTVMDSYKYAGVHSNMSNKDFKTRCFIDMLDQHQAYKDLDVKVQTPTGEASIDMENKINLEAAYSKYHNSLAAHYVHQECWILNSYPAQRIEF
ncbi:hypothetical protein [Yersinia enterocolitica]|uniref:hypothetical protein n=1 Tax=Yersinia enterocolitica TaxID=630 RepID=UPI0021E956DB|nr:hypothetical protein [Yersinia enterocolitica]UYK05166.1 hypothetical protein N4218_16585 [Yersinia enterocolitica]